MTTTTTTRHHHHNLLDPSSDRHDLVVTSPLQGKSISQRRGTYFGTFSPQEAWENHQQQHHQEAPGVQRHRDNAEARARARARAKAKAKAKAKANQATCCQNSGGFPPPEFRQQVAWLALALALALDSALACHWLGMWARSFVTVSDKRRWLSKDAVTWIGNECSVNMNVKLTEVELQQVRLFQ